MATPDHLSDDERLAASLWGSPAHRARDILREHWNGSIPVDPGKIAESLGVRVVPVGTLLTPAEYSGYFKRSDPELGGPVIRYNRNDPLVRKRFTVAHEIGHFVLGHNDAPRDTPENFSASTTDSRERSANQFAAELLMPENAVRQAAMGGRFSSVEELADVFKVSGLAMSFRLTNLKLSVW